MQATLIFNLPEEQELFRYHNETMNYRAIIDHFGNIAKQWDKIDASLTAAQVREAFQAVLATYNYE